MSDSLKVKTAKEKSSEKTPTVEKPVEKKTSSGSKTLKIVLIVFAVMVIVGILVGAGIVVGGYLFLASQKPTTSVVEDVTNTEDGATQDENTNNTDTGSTETKPEPNLKRVVYLKNSNIWVMNNDGSGKKRITSDGDSSGSVRYLSPAWKGAGVVGYVKTASNVCKIYSYKLSTSETNNEATISNCTYLIAKWSHSGEVLSYLVTYLDGNRKFFIRDTKSTAGTVLAFQFYPVVGRGIGLSDSQDIEFSPDDSKIVLTNTFGGADPADPTKQDKYSIVVMKRDGSILQKIVYPSTFGTFTNNSTIAYVTGGKLLQKNVNTSAIGTLSGSFHGYNLAGSPDGNFIAFYSLNETTKITTLYRYDVAGSPVIINTKLGRLEWIDDTYGIAQKTSPNIPDEEGLDMKQFNVDGLVKVKVKIEESGGSYSIIESGEINSFEVE